MLYQLSYKCILVCRRNFEILTLGLRDPCSASELPAHYLEDTLHCTLCVGIGVPPTTYLQCIIKVMVDPVRLELTYSD